MHSYSIYHPRKDAADIMNAHDEAVFVKQGFSWSTLVWQPLWFVYHGLWLAAILYAALLIVIIVLAGIFASAWAVIVFITIAILIAFEASDIWSYFLSLRGYHRVGFVAGGSLSECEQRFFNDCELALGGRDATIKKQMVPQSPATINPRSPTPLSRDDDEAVIGLFPKPGA